VLDEQVVVERVRVVIVQLAALCKGQFIVALVVAVVGDQTNLVLPEPPAMPMIRLFMSQNPPACRFR